MVKVWCKLQFFLSYHGCQSCIALQVRVTVEISLFIFEPLKVKTYRWDICAIKRIFSIFPTKIDPKLDSSLIFNFKQRIVLKFAPNYSVFRVM